MSRVSITDLVSLSIRCTACSQILRRTSCVVFWTLSWIVFMMIPSKLFDDPYTRWGGIRRDVNVCSGSNLSTRRRHPGTYYRRRRNVSSVSRDQRRGPSRSPVARCFPLRSRLSNVSGPALAACQQVPVGSGFEDSGGRGQERHGATTIPLGWFYPFGTVHQSTASCTTNGWSCLYLSRRPFQIPRIVAPLRQRHETVTLVRAALPSRSILWRSVPWNKNVGVQLPKNIEKSHFLLLK